VNSRNAGVLAGWTGGVSPPNRQTLPFGGVTPPSQPAGRQRSIDHAHCG